MRFGATKGSTQLPTTLRKGGWPLFLPQSQADQKISDWHPEIDTDRAVVAFKIRSSAEGFFNVTEDGNFEGRV